MRHARPSLFAQISGSRSPVIGVSLGGKPRSAGTLDMVCWHIMVRTTVKIPEDLDERLRHEARRRGSTISDVTRSALEAHLRVGRRQLRAAAAGHRGTTK